MVEIVGIGFMKTAKTYYFDPAGEKYEVGDKVIVETARGLELGEVVVANRNIDENKLVAALKFFDNTDAKFSSLAFGSVFSSIFGSVDIYFESSDLL